MEVDYGEEYEDEYGNQSDDGDAISEVDRLIGIALFALSTGVLFLVLKFAFGIFVNGGVRRQKRHSTNLENTKIQWKTLFFTVETFFFTHFFDNVILRQ